MTREAVGAALNAMADEEVRSKIAAGDLSVLDDDDLTDAEREILVGAAEDYPEVSGYSFNFSFNFNAPPPRQFNYADHGQFGIAAHHAFGDNAGLAAIYPSL